MYKLKFSFRELSPLILVFLIVGSFLLSVAAFARTIRTDKHVSALASSVQSLTMSVEKLTNDISGKLSAIDAHVSLIEKYAVDNYYWFYDIDTKGRVTISDKKPMSKNESYVHSEGKSNKTKQVQ